MTKYTVINSLMTTLHVSVNNLHNSAMLLIMYLDKINNWNIFLIQSLHRHFVYFCFFVVLCSTRIIFGLGFKHPTFIMPGERSNRHCQRRGYHRPWIRQRQWYHRPCFRQGQLEQVGEQIPLQTPSDWAGTWFVRNWFRSNALIRIENNLKNNIRHPEIITIIGCTCNCGTYRCK